MEINVVEDLVCKAKSGDRVAAERVVSAFRPCVMKMIRGYRISSYDFDDLVNECNYAIVRLIEAYEVERHSFTKFCKVGIRNHLINLFKRNHDGDVGFDDFDGMCEIISDDLDMEGDVFRWELRRDVSRLLGDLSKDEREILTFVYLKGNTLSDFSRMKRIPYSQARSRRDTSINKFRRILLKNRISFSL